MSLRLMIATIQLIGCRKIQNDFIDGLQIQIMDRNTNIVTN